MFQRFGPLLLACSLFAQQRPQRPGLFFAEEWKTTMETPLTQDFVSNADLELRLYRPTGKEMRVTSEGNLPPHTFSGMCTQMWAVALRHKESFADQRGLAKLRWSTRTSCFHLLRPIVKLADGYDFDWHESEFPNCAARS